MEIPSQEPDYQGVKTVEKLVCRYYNVAAVALDELAHSALKSHDAREELRYIADCLVKRAGDARRLDDLSAPSNDGKEDA